jgi:hypothetical protein
MVNGKQVTVCAARPWGQILQDWANSLAQDHARRQVMSISKEVQNGSGGDRCVYSGLTGPDDE